MKSKHFRYEFHHKLTIIFGIIIAVILIGVYRYLNEGYREDIYNRIQKNLQRETNLAKSFLERHLPATRDSAEWDHIADQIGQDLQLRVTIIAMDGTVLGDSELDIGQIRRVENHIHRAEVQSALKSGTGQRQRFSMTVKTSFLYMASVFGQEEPRGIVRLAIPLSDIERSTVPLKNVLVLSLIFAFGFSVLLSFLASTYFTKPIREISLSAQKIAAGDLSERIPLITQDVVKDLSEAITSMVEQLKSRISEAALGKSRLEGVLLSMFEGVLVVDSQGNILLMNQALKDFLHIEDDPIGKKTLEVIRNSHIQQIVTHTLPLRDDVHSSEVTLLFPVERTLLVHATPILRDKKSEGVVLIFHDITELRKLEKMRQEFVANVSHELRTPVSNIKGYAETLIDGAIHDRENAMDFLNIIVHDADRLVRLIEDILDLSGIESGSLKLNLKPCVVKLIVDRALAGLGRQIAEKKLDVRNDVPASLSYVLADEDRLAQVFVNLIDNAVKYTPEKGTVTITAQDQGDRLQVSVQDTGMGIPVEDLPRIFERFYRVDKARSRELGGTGLGLSIVKHIISAHGGDVNVASQVGHGSTFRITLRKA